MDKDTIEERGKPFHKKKLLLLLFMLFVIVIGIGAYFIDNDQKRNDIGVGKWVYNITYELDGGILPENAPKTYDNRKETALVNPTKEGYTFKGWRMSIKPESWEDGFISLDTGEDGLGPTGAGYPNAKRTGFIKLNKGVTYKLSISDTYGRMRIYDKDKKYVISLGSNENKEFILTPQEDRYVRLLVLDSTAVNISDVYLKVENYVTSIPKGTAGNINLTAEWKANTSVVSFNGNGADSGSIPNMTMTYDQSKTLPKNSFTKKGYKFSGWSTNQYGTGTNFNDEQIVKNLTTVNNGTVVLYAQWIKTNQKIIVNPNNGEDKYTLSGSYYEAFKVYIPKRTGYTFNGWTQSQNSGDIGIENKIVDFNNPNIISEGKIKPYIYYTKIPDNSTSEYGQLTMVEASQDNPTNNKYEIKITSNKEFIDDKGIRTYFGFHMDTSETHDKEKYYYHTFKAKLPKGTKLKYCYNTLGDNGGITWLTSNYGTGEWEDYTYKAYAGKNSNGSVIGYVIVESIDKQKVLTPFDWYLAESKIIKSENNPNTNILMIGSEDYEITAQWKPNTYTIKLHPNGNAKLVEGKSDTIQATYDQSVVLPSNVFNWVGIPTSISSYNTKSDGSGINYNVNDNSVKNLTNENNGTIDLYAQWRPTIDFNSIYHKGKIGNGYRDGENVKSFQAILTKPDGSTNTRFADNGDYGSKIDKGDILELKFIDYRFGYQFNKYVIRYNGDSNSAVNNGITILSQDETSIKLRVDKTYSDTRSIINLGWYNEEIPYSLSYNLDGGTLSNGVTNPTGYNVRSENITLNNPTKPGYTFEGWEEVLRPTQWHKGDLQNLPGDANDGQIYESTRGSYYSDFVSVKAGHKYKCNTHDYGEFGARYYDKNFNYVGYITDVLKTGYTVPQDGYIRFVMPRYEVNKDNILPYVKLTNMTLQKNITVEKGSVGNREYIAKWRLNEIPYNINYNLDGGTLPSDAPKIYYSSKGLDTLPVPTKSGYIFKGWIEENYKEQENIILSVKAGEYSKEVTFDTDVKIQYKFRDKLALFILTNTNGNDIFLESNSSEISIPKGVYTLQWGPDEYSVFSSLKIYSYIISIPIGTTGNKQLVADWEEMKRMISGPQFNEKLTSEKKVLQK